MKTGTISKTGDSYVLYDADIIAEPGLQLFDRDYHTNILGRQNNSVKTGIGRARAVYFTHGGKPMVLKHYYRGGLVATFLKDRYLGIDIERSRAFREWRLLNAMHALGLPVPRAVAARVRKGLLSYTADLVTLEISDAATLADILGERSITAAQWKKVGKCIAAFHRHDVYHADMNARNILFSGEEADVYLIDFDNSDFRADGRQWKMANLARLKRSLLKFKRNDAGFHFTEADWSGLLEGYKEG